MTGKIALRNYFVALFLASLVSAVGCKGRHQPFRTLDLTQKLIDASSLNLVRLPGLETAHLKFRGAKPLRCALKFWTRSTETAPREKDCVEIDAVNFDETLTELRPNEDLIVQIFAWEPTETNTGHRYLVFQEGDAKLNDTAITSLMVVDTSTTHHLGQIFQATMPEPTTPRNMLARLAYPTGCGQGPMPHHLLKENLDFDPKSLKVLGLPVGLAKPHPSNAHALLFFFDFFHFNTSQDWQIDQTKLSFAPPGRLMALTLTSGQNSFVLPHLPPRDAPSASWVLSPNAPLNLAWQTRFVGEQAEIAVQLTSEQTNSEVHCIFRPEDRNGIILEEFLKPLPSGTYQFQAVLETRQYQRIPHEKFPAWLMRFQDWRLARITKS